MKTILNISDAAAIAFHAAVMLAEHTQRPLRTPEIAGFLEISPAHLSKVMQRLAKAGIVCATRGPSGGFTLRKKPVQVKLGDIYQAIEGSYRASRCLFGEPRCLKSNCFLGRFIDYTDNAFRKLLNKTLSDAAASGISRNLKNRI